MKYIYLLLISICFFTLNAKSQNAPIMVSNPNGTVSKPYYNLDTAIYYSNSGDFIYLPGGIYTISDTIKKELHIYGTGIVADSSIYIGGVTTINSNLVFSPLGSNSSVTGIITNNITLDAPTSSLNLTLSRTKANEVYINILSGSVYIKQNLILTGIRGNSINNSNILIANNIFPNGNIIGTESAGNCYGWGYRQGACIGFLNGATIKNNVLFPTRSYSSNECTQITSANACFCCSIWDYLEVTYTDIQNCILENNIFKSYNGMTGGASSNNIFSNNLITPSGFSGYLPTVTFAGASSQAFNVIDSSLNHTFDSITNCTTFLAQSIIATQYKLQLNTISLGNNAGSDGKDIGIYGGEHPIRQIPTNPHFEFANIDTASNSFGMLPCNIQVKSGDTSLLVAYEYWFDSNYSNKHYVELQSNSIQNLLPSIDVSDAPVGTNTIHIRFKNSNGIWSSAISHTFTQGNQFTLNVPYINTNASAYLPSSTIQITGSLYTPNCSTKVVIHYPNNYTEAIVTTTDGLGKINYSYTPPSTLTAGTYHIYAKDLCTFSNSQVQQFVVLDPSANTEYLKIKSNFENVSLNNQNQITISWNDLLLKNKNGITYTMFPNSAKRHYSYDIEYLNASSVWTPIATSSGTAIVNIEHNFTYPINTSIFAGLTSTQLRIKDTYDPNNFDITLPFTINSAVPNTTVKLLTDFSSTPVINPVGVVADGVSRLYLELTNNTLNPITNVQAELTDQWNNTSYKRLGKLSVPTNITTYTDEANSLNTTTAANSNAINNKFYFWYVAPEDFAWIGILDKSERIVKVKLTITYANSTSSVEYKDISVVRTPLVFVHGLNSDKSAFENFKPTPILGQVSGNFTKDIRYSNSLVRMIEVKPFASFQRNAEMLMGINPVSSIDNLPDVVKTMRAKGYACNQVDYVGHSMGGLIIRQAEANVPSFYSQENYGLGMVHKLITVNSPHNSSPLADLANKLAIFINEKLDNTVGNTNCDYKDVLGFVKEIYESTQNKKLEMPFFRFNKPQQVCTQGAFNLTNGFLNEFFDVDISNNIFFKYDFETAQAMKNLMVVDGINLSSTPLKSHLIASDIFYEVNDIPSGYNLGMPNNLYDVIQEQIDKVKWVEKLSEFVYATTQNPNLKSTLKEILDEINTPQSARIMKLLDKLELLYGIAWYGSTAISYVADCDLIVPLKSQLADFPKTQDNVKVFNRYTHFNVTDQTTVADYVMDLLNNPIGSTQFQPILANTSLNKKKRSALTFFDSLVVSKYKHRVDTNKVKINLAELTIFKVDSIYQIQVNINDTNKLKYVELNYQDQQYRKYTKAGILTFEVPVQGTLYDTSTISVKAFYDYTDSAVAYFDGKRCIFKSDAPLQDFKFLKHTYLMRVNDTIQPLSQIKFANHLTYLSIYNKEIMINIQDTNIIKFSHQDRAFVAKIAGETYAIVSYKGLIDTIYFSIENVITIPNFPLAVGLIQNPINTQNCKAMISWDANSTNKGSVFFIQKSIDGTNYSNISSVLSESNKIHYSYMDANVSYGNNYYRIAVKDVDGKMFYSNIQSLNSECNLSNTLKVYPNPASEIINVDLLLNNAYKTVSLKTIDGQILETLKVNANNIQQIKFNVKNLSNGTYIIVADKRNGEKEVAKFIKE